MLVYQMVTGGSVAVPHFGASMAVVPNGRGAVLKDGGMYVTC